jgi:hypothetical protein
MNTIVGPNEVQEAEHEPEYFSARDISRALSTPEKKICKKTIQRTAQREGWAFRRNANRIEYAPPAHIADIVLSTPRSEASFETPAVKFADLVGPGNQSQRETVLLREKAVTLLQNNVPLLGKENALKLVCQHFAKEHPLFKISVSSLRRWDDAFAANGIDGLVEQKRGRVGRKAFALDLTEEEILKGRAAAVEHGIKGRTNVARAFRVLASDPTISGQARQWLHGGRVSKSSVPPSVRDALRVPIGATKLIQTGPKAAKLDGAFTECSYENVPAGKAFTADDMTANVYVWCEWPNEQGFIVIRPQILAAMDIGTMRWLCMRAVIRSKGQYNRDDVWGLIGDVMDDYGRYEIAVLEGGIWQSNVVIGQKTSIDDATRFGGLKSLGVKVIHTRTPRGKIIETAFNQLQHAADNCPGYCGRMEMKDCPEILKQQLADIRTGKAHPRQYLMHVNEYSAHLTGVMESLNNERNDGKILRGLCPNDKWAQDAPQLDVFPDAAKWMYRSAYNIVQVTRNGVRVTLGSGRFQQVYTYASPSLETHRGRRVIVFWNDHNPDTDAVIYTVQNGRPHSLICVASRLQSVPRFDAGQGQLQAEATRKKLSHQMAVNVRKTLSPYLQRQTGNAAPLNKVSEISERITDAREKQDNKEQTRREISREINRADVNTSDVIAALGGDGERTEAAEMSAEDISQLFDESPSRIEQEEPQFD